MSAGGTTLIDPASEAAITRTSMIDFKPVRDLSLHAAAKAGRPPYLSAASGLVQAGAFLYVVADDEHHLGIFPRSGGAPGALLRIFAGDLPLDKGHRKRRKRDLEALTRLPPFPGYAAGALMALGSGSKRNRRTGAVLALDAQGAVVGPPRLIDLTGLHKALKDRFDDLNIEGAAVTGDQLLLLQRGNKGDASNACIRFGLGAMLAALTAGDALAEQPPSDVRGYDLGEIAGVPLCFTDCAVLPTGDLIFTAVAENTEDSYHDGACAGAAIGSLSRDGSLHALERLAHPYKVEGIHATLERDRIRLLAVTDADDVNIPATLLCAEFRASLLI